MSKPKIEMQDLPGVVDEETSEDTSTTRELMLPPGVGDNIGKLKEKGWPHEKVCEALSTLSYLGKIDVSGAMETLKHVAIDHDNLPAAILLRAMLGAMKEFTPLMSELQRDAEVTFIGHGPEELDDAIRVLDRKIEELKSTNGDTLH